MGGGSGFLGLGAPELPKAPKIPDPVIPAVPAPMTKQDTGAIVKTGGDSAEDIRNRRPGRLGGGRSIGASTLGTLGRIGSLGL